MKRTRVKFCGICSVEDALVAAEAGCDAIGMVFYPESPRYIDSAKAEKICKALPPFISKVALFVNADEEAIRQVLDTVYIDAIQFHGSESDDFCQQFGKPYIKAMSMTDDASEKQVMAFSQQFSSASGILLDAHDEQLYGGSGKVFDWSRIPLALRGKIILAGGLSYDNVSQAIRQVSPFAVDVSTGIESVNEQGKTIKGKKDKEKMNLFMHQVRISDAAIS